MLETARLRYTLFAQLSRMNGTVHNAPSGSLIEQAIAESIDALAAPRVRAAVVELALRWARLEYIPSRGNEVSEFVEGALYRAAEQMLGFEVAEAVKSDLAPMVSMLRDQEVSAVRPSAPPDADSDYPEIQVQEPEAAAPVRRSQRPWLATMPEPIELKSVSVASTDPAAVSEMSRWLGGVALVEPVQDALAILENLGAGCDLVVVDCRRPAVSVETLVTLAPEMPEQSKVVLWGERQDLELHLGQLGARMPAEWVCCGPAASAEDVGAIVRILLE